MIVVKPDYLNLIIKTYFVEGENWLHNLSFDCTHSYSPLLLQISEYEL